MAEGIISSPAFGRELVEYRTLKLTVQIPEPLRSLVLPDLLYLSSYSTDLWLRWLRALELLRLLLHLEGLELRSFDRLLRLLERFSRLVGILFLLLLLSSSELARLSSLSIKKDSVNNGRSDRDLTRKRKKKKRGPDREEDNRVSSENKEGRLDDDGIEVPDRRAGETPGPSAVISRGILGLDSLFESALKQRLRDLDVNLNSLEKMLKSLNPTDLLTAHPLFKVVLAQKMNDISRDLLRMLETNSKLGSKELKDYYHPICWNSTKRLEFLCRLSDRLLLKAKAPNQQDELKVLLSEELESKRPLVYDGRWIDKIDHKFRSRRQYDNESVGALLRFVRNQWCHLPDEFEEFLGLGSAERLYDYFDARFPKLLVVSYGAASRFCKEEKWFEEYC